MNNHTSTAPLTEHPVSYSIPHRFVVEAFRRVDVSDADASVTADVLTTTDAWGIFTHGTKNVRGYLRRLQAGGLRATGRPCLGPRDQPGESWTVTRRWA